MAKCNDRLNLRYGLWQHSDAGQLFLGGQSIGFVNGQALIVCADVLGNGSQSFDKILVIESNVAKSLVRMAYYTGAIPEWYELLGVSAFRYNAVIV